ncbi:MAG: large conductance mechanosensitive channel protein MscL [Candidatus Eisenbacteria bacterium]
MISDFRKFLRETNALALAVAVIIGGAVGKVVSSLAGDILMPIIGLAIPGGAWREASLVLTSKADGTPASVITYGAFLGAVVDFIIIAVVVYMMARSIMKPPAAAPAPATKQCPECAETILKEAKRCKFCCQLV